jgi:hypothetical protein
MSNMSGDVFVKTITTKEAKEYWIDEPIYLVRYVSGASKKSELRWYKSYGKYPLGSRYVVHSAAPGGRILGYMTIVIETVVEEGMKSLKVMVAK